MTNPPSETGLTALVVRRYIGLVSAKKPTAAGTAAILALRRAGVPHTVRAFAHDPRTHLGYGLEAATALGLPAEQLFKTLVAKVDGDLAVGIIPVTASLSMKALATALGGKKGTMAEIAEAERATGYVVGGISPLGQRRAHPTVIDSTAADLDMMYVSAGSRGLDVGIAPADLARLTGAVFASIAR
ncbi:MAG: Cys-tRNA(Pro) deacylase [Bifidobacteriaceae bacterium]|jgi:Cys-tRNA(Pro)/Cys-tRNA(Cys) deacylase|nr:Cys-tRNA(Pro) deacylase [Bifidobacteriaceae bacterium]